jgi:hypothetical protein
MIRDLTEIASLMFFGWTIYFLANLIMGAA